MSYEYEEEELSLKCKGVEYKFRAPSAFEQKEVARKFKESTDQTDVVELYIEFFVGLGLPREVLSSMTMKGLLGLFSYSLGTKKN